MVRVQLSWESNTLGLGACASPPCRNHAKGGAGCAAGELLLAWEGPIAFGDRPARLRRACQCKRHSSGGRVGLGVARYRAAKS
jgi:hypothetical protein